MSTKPTLGPHRIEFEPECEARTTSWKRADPSAALIEKFGRFGFKVLLQDGADVHYCALGTEAGEYLGRCDCKGWLHHEGPCAHLCVLRKAEFIGHLEIDAVDESPEAQHEMADETGEMFAGERYDPHHPQEDQARPAPPFARAHPRTRAPSEHPPGGRVAKLSNPTPSACSRVYTEGSNTPRTVYTPERGDD